MNTYAKALQALRLRVTLTAKDNDRTTAVFARHPNINGGIWIISERARKAAYRRMGLETDTGANPPVESTHTVRAIDADGWHTYTIYGA